MKPLLHAGKWMISGLLSLFIFIVFFLPAFGQSKTVTALSEKGLHDTQLYFYPSTLRMLNLEKDPLIYELVADINRLRLMTFSGDSLLAEGKAGLVKALTEEGYEEVMSYRASDVNVSLYGKYRGEEMRGMVAFVLQDDQKFLIDLDGKVDPMKVYQVSQKGLNMPVLDSFFKNKQEEESRREKYRQFRESMKEEDSETDSLSTSDSTASGERSND